MGSAKDAFSGYAQKEGIALEGTRKIHKRLTESNSRIQTVTAARALPYELIGFGD